MQLSSKRKVESALKLNINKKTDISENDVNLSLSSPAMCEHKLINLQVYVN